MTKGAADKGLPMSRALHDSSRKLKPFQRLQHFCRERFLQLCNENAFIKRYHFTYSK